MGLLTPFPTLSTGGGDLFEARDALCLLLDTPGLDGGSIPTPTEVAEATDLIDFGRGIPAAVAGVIPHC